MKKDPLPPPTANLATAIIGFWKLKSREDVDATGKVHIDPFLGRDPLGILCFGKTHFSAQFMKRDRSGENNWGSGKQLGVRHQFLTGTRGKTGKTETLTR